MTLIIHFWLSTEEDGAEFIPAACYLEPAARAPNILINTPTQGARATGASTVCVFYESLDMPSIHSP